MVILIVSTDSHLPRSLLSMVSAASGEPDLCLIKVEDSRDLDDIPRGSIMLAMMEAITKVISSHNKEEPK